MLFSHIIPPSPSPTESKSLFFTSLSLSLSHIWSYACYNAILSNHPTPAFSHRVQKSVLYICVSCCLAYRAVVTVFLNSVYMR